MQVIYKMPEEEYNNLYVTSDTHFGHNKEFLYGKRGYQNPEEMNQDMIRIINETVGENGILLHLGDFCLNTSLEQYQSIMFQLKVKAVWMMWGNHNNPIQKSYGGSVQQIAGSIRGTMVRYLQHYFTFRKGRKTFVCFHFPIHSWDGMSDGGMHLCGHSHGTLPISRPENKTHKILDCGWDVHGKPLSFKEVEAIMDTKDINNVHHAKYLEFPVNSEQY
jgi:calcineurin-like phosphoesterase family protein